MHEQLDRAADDTGFVVVPETFNIQDRQQNRREKQDQCTECCRRSANRGLPGIGIGPNRRSTTRACSKVPGRDTRDPMDQPTTMASLDRQPLL